MFNLEKMTTFCSGLNYYKIIKAILMGFLVQNTSYHTNYIKGRLISYKTQKLN